MNKLNQVGAGSVSTFLDTLNSNFEALDPLVSPADSSWLKKTIGNFIYPIGSFYLSTSSSDPGGIFGGTWEQIEDHVLYPVGTEKSAGQTGEGFLNALGVVEAYLKSGDSAGYGLVNEEYKNASGATSLASYKGRIVVNDTVLVDTSAEDSKMHRLKDINRDKYLPPYYTIYCWRRTGLASD